MVVTVLASGSRIGQSLLVVDPAEPMVGSQAPGVTKALRWTGLGCLAAVVAVDIAIPIVTRWRRAAATKAIQIADHVAPTERFMLDAALGLLRASNQGRT